MKKDFVIGGISGGDGTPISSTNRICSSDYYAFDSDIKISINSDYMYALRFYNSNGNFFVPSNSELQFFTHETIILKKSEFDSGDKFKIVIKKSDDNNISENEINSIVSDLFITEMDSIFNKVESLIHTSEEHWNGKKWYAYGTSMTATGSGKYAPYVAEFSGLQLTNKGIGGQGITNVGAYSTGANKEAVMNLTDGKTEADLISLEVGPNDTGAPLGTIHDMGNDTFCGCLNQCIRYLQKNTNAQIVIMSMTQSRYPMGSPDDIYTPDRIITDTLGGTYTWHDMCKSIRECCEVNNCYYIPVGESSGLGLSRVSDQYLVDQIHLTELGGYNVALFIWNKLRNIPMWYTKLPM